MKDPAAGARLGRVREVWRYPVKSLAGERVECVAVSPGIGIAGDRGWALRDESLGEIRSAKKWPRLLELSASCLEEPQGSGTPPVRIRLPDGSDVRSDDPTAAQRIGAFLGETVSLHPRVPASQRAHYRRREPIVDMEASIRESSELLPDEPAPDLASLGDLPADFSLVADHVTPPGTYFDFFALHLLTTRSLESFARRAPASRIDVRRFRPNIVVDLDDPPEADAADFPEFDWCGGGLVIGDVELKVVMPMMRCAMTTHAQGDLPKDSRIMRALVRESGMNMGVGIDVARPGRIAVGDEVRLVDATGR